MSQSSLGYGTAPVIWNVRNNKVAIAGVNDGALSPGRMVGYDSSEDPPISGVTDVETQSGTPILLVKSAAVTGNVLGVVMGRDKWKSINDGPTGIYTGLGIAPGRDGNIIVFGPAIIHCEAALTRGALVGPGGDPNLFATAATPDVAYGALMRDTVETEILDPDTQLPVTVYVGYAFVNFYKHIFTGAPTGA